MSEVTEVMETAAEAAEEVKEAAQASAEVVTEAVEAAAEKAEEVKETVTEKAEEAQESMADYAAELEASLNKGQPTSDPIWARFAEQPRSDQGHDRQRCQGRRGRLRGRHSCVYPGFQAG